MRTDRRLRVEMLRTAGTILDNVTGDGQVEFFNLAGDPICELEFQSSDIVSAGGDNAILRLKSIDGSYTLKGTSYAEGPVDSFKIFGKIVANPPDVPVDISDYFLIGTIGTLASSAELRFNIIDWVAGTFISIENFDIVLPNGV